MPRKSIDKYLRVTIITTAGIDNDFVYSLERVTFFDFLFFWEKSYWRCNPDKDRR